MTRIQRARALRLGYILASLLWAGSASALPQDVPGAGFDPELDACWASGPATPEHLGPCLGMSADEIGTTRAQREARKAEADEIAMLKATSFTLTVCEQASSLWWDAAVAAGVDADAAWEDGIAACEALSK